MKKVFFYLSLVLLLSSCSVKPKGLFSENIPPLPPDYTKASTWAALPLAEDCADLTPGDQLKDNQANAEVDVFFLYPTSYTGTKGQKQWNGSLEDEALNEKIDNFSIKYQSSIFNGIGKIYAPRYRQAHIHIYFEKKRVASAKEAFDLAYEDVKAAFEYYLANYNNGRPIVIAGHSQGTSHSMRLLKDYFEGKPLMNQLVAAYIPGMIITDDYFKEIPVCQSPEQIGCFCTWRTFKKGYIPKRFYEYPNNYVSVNPIAWTTDETVAQVKDHDGALLLDYEAGVVPNLLDAQNHRGILWVSKPKFRGSVLYTTKDYHVADMNFFYADIRENAALRVKAFLKK